MSIEKILYKLQKILVYICKENIFTSSPAKVFFHFFFFFFLIQCIKFSHYLLSVARDFRWVAKILICKGFKFVTCVLTLFFFMLLMNQVTIDYCKSHP